MATQELDVMEMSRLSADDAVWHLPAVAFMRDGSEIHLSGRSLRQAHDEMRRDGDEDVWFGVVNALAMRNLGVVLPEGQEPRPTQPPSPDSALAAGLQAADNWVQGYVAACGEVLTSATACLEVANVAHGARRKIVEHQHDGLPGTPIAIRNFTRMAEAKEAEFAPLYRAFDDACTNARDTAARFLAAGDNEQQAEVALMMSMGEDILDRVATAKAILSATYGPSPAAFIQGVQASNELMQNPPDDGIAGGNIYRPGSGEGQ